MREKKVPLSIPNFGKEERDIVNDAMLSNWVSAGGPLVKDFERDLAAYVGMPRAVACDSGTAALHTGFMVAEVGPGDEVLCCPLTYIAAINPIRYVGAEPVFIDCDDSLCIDPAKVEAFCATQCEMRDGKLIDKATGAHVKMLEVIHIFGNMADMEGLMAVAEKYGLLVLEDATETLGSRYTSGRFAGQYAGTIGDVGCYSFNGNKIITTGSGGMLVTRHDSWADRAMYLTNQATDDLGADTYRQFIHSAVGYHYRLTNLAAGLGIVQLTRLEGFIEKKDRFHKMYTQALDGKNGYRVLGYRENARCNKWFFSLYLEDCPLSRDEMIRYLDKNMVDTRPIWTLINENKPYRDSRLGSALTKAEDYRARVVNLPCSTTLNDDDIRYVIDVLLKVGK